MGKSLAKGVLAIFAGCVLITLPGCSSGSFFSSFFHRSAKSSSSDTRFRKDYPELKALLRDNHFRMALAWVETWEKDRTLSADDRRLLRKDKKTIRLIGAAYYMGVARERRKSGRLRGALAALDTARTFTPDDPVLRSEIEKTKARHHCIGTGGTGLGGTSPEIAGLKGQQSPAERRLTRRSDGPTGSFPKVNTCRGTIPWPLSMPGSLCPTSGTMRLRSACTIG
ncbi:MAG: hypothetical protein D084_Lepto4C00230G0002 [Leptospirillum sp. Group IV 'UBA BS']|nr:MAG: hypothetical protein D084_Lepto4C00230G0002 [Leptospirillum sp. Group IV 'UBA BS']